MLFSAEFDSRVSFAAVMIDVFFVCFFIEVWLIVHHVYHSD